MYRYKGILQNVQIGDVVNVTVKTVVKITDDRHMAEFPFHSQASRPANVHSKVISTSLYLHSTSGNLRLLL